MYDDVGQGENSGVEGIGLEKWQQSEGLVLGGMFILKGCEQTG